MARKPGARSSGEFVLFDVIYEDGTQRSNRKVPSAALGGLDKDEPARAIISEQDAAIGKIRHPADADQDHPAGRREVAPPILCVGIAPGRHSRRNQSNSATARVQPPEAPLILCGKHETVKPSAGKLFQIAQLFHVAVGNFAAGIVALPDDRRIVRLHPALAGMRERRIPAPGVDAADPHAARGQIQRRLAPHAAAGATCSRPCRCRRRRGY